MIRKRSRVTKRRTACIIDIIPVTLFAPICAPSRYDIPVISDNLRGIYQGEGTGDSKHLDRYLYRRPRLFLFRTRRIELFRR